MPSAELRAFLRGETDAATFRHADHLRMGFEVLRRHGNFVEAAGVCSKALRAMAARAGKPNAYHETITMAFLALIAERLAADDHTDFDGFIRINADLLDRTVLTRWYAPERLACAAARATFLLPEPR